MLRDNFQFSPVRERKADYIVYKAKNAFRSPLCDAVMIFTNSNLVMTELEEQIALLDIKIEGETQKEEQESLKNGRQKDKNDNLIQN